MTDQLLYEVLEATGYLADGQPAHGVRIGNDAHVGDRTRSFRPDALWKGDSALTVYFKFEPRQQNLWVSSGSGKSPSV